MKKASARHILVASNEDCEGLKAKIKEGVDFAEVAKENSQCPSGKTGGGSLVSLAPARWSKSLTK